MPSTCFNWTFAFLSPLVNSLHPVTKHIISLSALPFGSVAVAPHPSVVLLNKSETYIYYFFLVAVDKSRVFFPPFFSFPFFWVTSDFVSNVCTWYVFLVGCIDHLALSKGPQSTVIPVGQKIKLSLLLWSILSELEYFSDQVASHSGGSNTQWRGGSIKNQGELYKWFSLWLFKEDIIV